MKKLILFLTITLIFTALAAEEKKHEANEKQDPYRVYVAENTYENFKNAMDHFYGNIDKDNNDGASHMMAAYVLVAELGKQLDYLDENVDSLAPGQKFGYANLLLSLNMFDESIEVYNKINEAAPKWSCPWRHKGEAYFKSGKLEQAEVALKKAIETRKEHYDAYIMLADVQDEMGKYEEALETFNTGLSYKGKDIEDAEEELSSLSEGKIHLRILKHNKENRKYKKLKKKLEKKYPEETF